MPEELLDFKNNSKLWMTITPNHLTNQNSKLLKMVDVLGKEYKEHKRGMLLFYIYDDGKVIKRMK